jgi:hypothetical protein
MVLALERATAVPQRKDRDSMSTGKIEVWIVGRESLCSVSQHEWKVCLLDCCSRRPVTFCGRELCEPTKCGTVDFEVPPGCYFVWASGPNDFAFGVATVGCGQQVCLTLVSPFHFLALATEGERTMFAQELDKMKPTPTPQPPTT